MKIENLVTSILQDEAKLNSELEYCASAASMPAEEMTEELWKSPQICLVNWRNVKDMFQMIYNLNGHIKKN